MTLSSRQTKIVYETDGAATDFAIPFPVFDQADVECLLVTAAGEIPYGSGFTVSLADGAAAASFVLPPPAGEKLVIRRATRLIQESDYPAAGRFPAKTLERDLDRLTAMIQDLGEYLDRAVKVDADQNAAPSADEFFREIDEKLAAVNQAAAAALDALELARAIMALVPAPEPEDEGKILGVSLDGQGRAVYAPRPGGGGGGGGMAEYALSPHDASGEMEITLAGLGHPPMPGGFNPLVNLISAQPYLYRITEKTAAGFSLRIYRPDGTAGVDYAASLECGTAACGGGFACGQGGAGANVRVAVSIPLP